MTELIYQIMNKMISLFKGDAKRIQHFSKVYMYAEFIGHGEKLDKNTMEVIEIAALTHDIGIHICEEKYGKSDGKLQEKEGPGIAEILLEDAEISKDVLERVCFLIGHHHTYENVDGIDWQILLEADYLVNAYEKTFSKDAVEKSYEIIFKTKTGKELCRNMFGLKIN